VAGCLFDGTAESGGGVSGFNRGRLPAGGAVQTWDNSLATDEMARGFRIAIVVVLGVAMGRGQTGKTTTFRGRYANIDYGFSVVIPNGLVGEGSGPDAPNHGFAIRLQSGTVVSVDASYETDLDSKTGTGPFNARLGPLEAERRSSQDNKSGVDSFHVSVVARGDDRGTPIIYTFNVDGDRAHEAEGLRVFESVVGSFQTIPIRP
jgi:hypothetical protein